MDRKNGEKTRGRRRGKLEEEEKRRGVERRGELKNINQFKKIKL